MKAATTYGPGIPLNWMRMGLVLLAFAGLDCLINEAAHAQDATAKGQDSSGKARDASGKPQTAPAKPDSAQSEEIEAPAATLPATSTPEERNREAWAILTDAAGDANRTQTRLQALAALGLLRSPRSSKMIAAAMTEPDLDVRTAAVLAAGQTKDRNLTTNIRNLLDDKEPQVAFAAARGSEERRVGKECRSPWPPHHYKK